MADAPSTAVAISTEVDRESFVETFNVREKGRRYEVAANAIANRAWCQINVAKLRTLGERAIKPYLDNPEMPISPKDFKTLVEGIQVVEDMAAQAYSDSKNTGNLANSLERLVYAAAKGAASGAQTPGSHSPEARLNRMKNLIGKAKPVAQVAASMEIVE